MLARIGWLRKEYRATYSQIHADIRPRVAISESHVRFLYQHVSPLLACYQRQQSARLAQVAQSQEGFIIALDGLEPEGGEPQLWFVRELQTGLTLRSGWLAQQSQVAFETFLAPLASTRLAGFGHLSDKQTGLVPAVASVFPKRSPQFCQAHYLRNLAEPLAEADAAFKSELRQAVRSHLGTLIRQEAVAGGLAQWGLNRHGHCPRVPRRRTPPERGHDRGTAKSEDLGDPGGCGGQPALASRPLSLNLEGPPPVSLS